MSSILDVYCRDNFSSAWISHPPSIENAQLFVGQVYNIQIYTCLYFTLPPLETLGSVQEAKLTLFNTPLYPFQTTIGGYQYHATYLLSPLLEYQTIYSCNTPPVLDYNSKISFQAASIDHTIEIDITALVHNWLTGNLPNKGLILYGLEPNYLISFGSSYSSCPTLVPFIRIKYLPVTNIISPEDPLNPLNPLSHLIQPGTSLDLTTSSKIYIDS